MLRGLSADVVSYALLLVSKLVTNNMIKFVLCKMLRFLMLLFSCVAIFKCGLDYAICSRKCYPQLKSYPWLRPIVFWSVKLKLRNERFPYGYGRMHPGLETRANGYNYRSY